MPRRPANPSPSARSAIDVQASVCAACDRTDEADHRIANHLALLAGYLRLKSRELINQPTGPTREGVRVMLESVAAQIGAVGSLHRALAQHTFSGTVDLGEHLHNICEPFQSGLGGVVSIVEGFAPGCRVSADQILPLTQIVAEVLTNAVKHAYPTGQTGHVRVSCALGPGGVEIEVIDHGKGLPPGFDPAADGGIGFRLLRSLSRQLGATTSFASPPNGGTRFNLQLKTDGPVPAA